MGKAERQTTKDTSLQTSDRSDQAREEVCSVDFTSEKEKQDFRKMGEDRSGPTTAKATGHESKSAHLQKEHARVLSHDNNCVKQSEELAGMKVNDSAFASPIIADCSQICDKKEGASACITSKIKDVTVKYLPASSHKTTESLYSTPETPKIPSITSVLEEIDAVLEDTSQKSDTQENDSTTPNKNVTGSEESGDQCQVLQATKVPSVTNLLQEVAALNETIDHIQKEYFDNSSKEVTGSDETGPPEPPSRKSELLPIPTLLGDVTVGLESSSQKPQTPGIYAAISSQYIVGSKEPESPCSTTPISKVSSITSLINEITAVLENTGQKSQSRDIDCEEPGSSCSVTELLKEMTELIEGTWQTPKTKSRKEHEQEVCQEGLDGQVSSCSSAKTYATVTSTLHSEFIPRHNPSVTETEPTFDCEDITRSNEEGSTVYPTSQPNTTVSATTPLKQDKAALPTTSKDPQAQVIQEDSPKSESGKLPVSDSIEQTFTCVDLSTTPVKRKRATLPKITETKRFKIKCILLHTGEKHVDETDNPSSQKMHNTEAVSTCPLLTHEKQQQIETTYLRQQMNATDEIKQNMNTMRNDQHTLAMNRKDTAQVNQNSATLTKGNETAHVEEQYPWSQKDNLQNKQLCMSADFDRIATAGHKNTKRCSNVGLTKQHDNSCLRQQDFVTKDELPTGFDKNMITKRRTDTVCLRPQDKWTSDKEPGRSNTIPSHTKCLGSPSQYKWVKGLKSRHSQATSEIRLTKQKEPQRPQAVPIKGHEPAISRSQYKWVKGSLSGQSVPIVRQKSACSSTQDKLTIGNEPQRKVIIKERQESLCLLTRGKWFNGHDGSNSASSTRQEAICIRPQDKLVNGQDRSAKRQERVYLRPQDKWAKEQELICLRSRDK